MRLRMAMWIGLAVAARGVAAGSADEATINVFVTSSAHVPAPVEQRARLTAAKVFHEAGIDVRFHEGLPVGHPAGKPLVVHLVEGVPFTVRPAGVLAYAYPFEGSRIDVMYDRVRRDNEGMTTALLAYVLVHEVTHVMQGMTLHTDHGVMKARWTSDDYAAMLRGKFHLDHEDVEMIRQGLLARAMGAASSLASK